MVPCMPVGRKMQNIAFTEKVQNFSNGDYCAQNFSYQLQTGFNQTFKGSKSIPQNQNVSDR